MYGVYGVYMCVYMYNTITTLSNWERHWQRHSILPSLTKNIGEMKQV